MKIGINLMLFGATPRSWAGDLPSRLRTIGAEWIEIPVFDPEASAFSEIARQLHDLEIGVSVSSALSLGASAVGDTGAAAIRWSDFLHRLADIAHMLGATFVAGPLYHPVGDFAPGSQDLLQGRLTERLAGWKPSPPVRFAIEPLNRFETNVLNLCADGANIIAAAANPAFELMADTFHMHIEERNPFAAFRALGSCCRHFHVSENDRGPVGAGQIDWPAWFAALRASHVSSVVVECFSSGLAELSAATRVWRDISGDPFDCALRSLRFLHEISINSPQK